MKIKLHREKFVVALFNYSVALVLCCVAAVLISSFSQNHLTVLSMPMAKADAYTVSATPSSVTTVGTMTISGTFGKGLWQATDGSWYINSAGIRAMTDEPGQMISDFIPIQPFEPYQLTAKIKTSGLEAKGAVIGIALYDDSKNLVASRDLIGSGGTHNWLAFNTTIRDIDPTTAFAALYCTVEGTGAAWFEGISFQSCNLIADGGFEKSNPDYIYQIPIDCHDGNGAYWLNEAYTSPSVPIIIQDEYALTFWMYSKQPDTRVNMDIIELSGDEQTVITKRTIEYMAGGEWKLFILDEIGGFQPQTTDIRIQITTDQGECVYIDDIVLTRRTAHDIT